MKTIMAFLLIFSVAFSDEVVFESKDKRVNLIELYTSQGCSSCPPADEWLGKLKNHDKLFKEFIPIAFHVTYWDYIGWKDVFANKLNDNRQRYYSARVWNKNSVYTPQFVINAKEYRQWFSNRSFPKFESVYGGDLKAVLNNNNLKISFFNKNIKNESLYLNVAILGFDYKVDIKRGENMFRTLEHDFVVLNHIQTFAKVEKNRLKYDLNLQDFKSKGNKFALVVWLSDSKSKIIQATGGYI